MRRLDRRHEVHRPDVFAEIALADLVDARFFERRHPREDLGGFGRWDGRVPLDEITSGHWARGEDPPYLSDIRERRGLTGRVQRRDNLGAGLALVLPADRHAQGAQIVIRE